MCVFTVISEESVPSKLSELRDGKNSLNYHHHDHVNTNRPPYLMILATARKRVVNVRDKHIDSEYAIPWNELLARVTVGF